MAGWVAVCHSRYCIKTTKHVLKLILPSGSPALKLLRPLAPIANFQGNPFIGGVKYTGGGKIWRFSTDIVFYLGNGATQADGYNGTLTGSHDSVTLHRATLNRATVNRRQFTGRQLTGATDNRATLNGATCNRAYE